MEQSFLRKHHYARHLCSKGFTLGGTHRFSQKGRGELGLLKSTTGSCGGEKVGPLADTLFRVNLSDKRANPGQAWHPHFKTPAR